MDRTRCIVMKFAPGKGPSFEWVASLVERRVLALQHLTHHRIQPQPNCLMIDVDGSRVMVAMAERPARADVVLVVGPSSDQGAPDILRAQRAAFCNLLCEAIKVHFLPGDVLQSQVSGRADAALATALLETARQFPVDAHVVAAPGSDRAAVTAEALRAAIYDAPTAREVAAVQPASLPLRIAIGTMTTVVTVASLPIGLALLAANAGQGANLRLTAATMAGLGVMQTVFGLSAFPML